MLTSHHQPSVDYSPNMPPGDYTPNIIRDTIQILRGCFETGELRDLVECLEEDGHRCNVFEDFEESAHALCDPRTKLLLIGVTVEGVSRWIEKFKTEDLHTESLNAAGVPIMAYFKEPSLAIKDAWLPPEKKGLLLHEIDDFLLAPLSLYDMRLRVHRLTQRFTETEDALRACQLNLIAQLGMQQFIGKSPAFMASIEKIPRVAACDASVLLIGNTGTGKEMCARAIHYLSPRAKKPFIPVNCGSIPDDLFENEMFGHESGAFTDARRSQRGLIGEAEGGTLFLDEVDSLPMSAQVKILRFLQDKEYRPLGATHYRQADTRLIAASNQDLQRKVRERTFREDLYYRLNVITLPLPTLRDRQEDILPLALHFLTTSIREYRSRATHFSPACIKKLLAHTWPGNVRELENIIRRAVVTVDGPVINAFDITLSTDVPIQIAPATESFKVSKSRMIEAFERNYLTEIISACDGNVSKAARHAKKNRRAFFALLKKYNITSTHPSQPAIHVAGRESSQQALSQM
ncbi:MAG TPA: sigma-54 dependent transcriptional regulator [Pyrinomonadaceae bacterium]|nr:sigma-54 dependent transcriptional regulator [Pyrinomonadaceae bacterium]